MTDKFLFKTGVDSVFESGGLKELYNSVGWTTYTSSEKQLVDAISNSTFVLSCFDKSKLIGLARSLSDDVAIHHVQDILVRPEYQRMGIGRELLTKTLKHFEHVRTHILMTDNSTQQLEFYTSLGFHNTRGLKEHPLNVFVQMRNIDLK